jgi:hypothetical protein
VKYISTNSYVVLYTGDPDVIWARCQPVKRFNTFTLSMDPTAAGAAAAATAAI